MAFDLQLRDNGASGFDTALSDPYKLRVYWLRLEVPAATGGAMVVVNIFSGRGGGAASPLVG